MTQTQGKILFSLFVLMGIMTGFFAMFFLIMSRLIYKKKGMQFGMGIVAGSLRYFNPFGGCQICASIAIVAEALIFELIFNYLSTLDLTKIKSLTSKAALGIFSAYSIYVGGTIITQILTPISFGNFYIENFFKLFNAIDMIMIGQYQNPASQFRSTLYVLKQLERSKWNRKYWNI